MPRRDNRNNPLQIQIKAKSVPRVSPKTYWARLLAFIETGKPLPSSWSVEIGWRNPKTRSGRSKQWQWDSFEEAVSDSGGGFGLVVARMIGAKLRRLSGEKEFE